MIRDSGSWMCAKPETVWIILGKLWLLWFPYDQCTQKYWDGIKETYAYKGCTRTLPCTEL